MKKLIFIMFMILATFLNAEVLFFDDFEAGLGNWDSIINSGTGEWLIYGEPFPNTYTMPTTSIGNICVADADEAGSGNSTDCTIVLTTPLNLAIYDDIFLEFDSDFRALDTDDICYVDVSVDGSNWTNVLTYPGDSVRETHEIIDISNIASLESSVYIRFHSVQPGWDWWWAIDNVSVSAEIAVALTAPAAPTSVIVTPDPTGSLSTDISWICPAVDVEGNTLTELTEMLVYRDEILIYTDTAPVIGGPGDYTDFTLDNGFYTYTIYGSNSSGNGVPVLETIFVGEDAPAVVSNLTLVQSSPGELSGTLTWINPTTGLNGGVLNDIDGYSIERSDGATISLVGEATEYIDDTIPASGNYWYSVQPYNSLGLGETVISNSVLIADEGLLVMEGFEGGTIPAGWSQEYVVGDNDWIYQNGGAGTPSNPLTAHTGSYNAAFTHITTDNSTKLITPEINLGTANDGELTFWHAQVNWVGDQDELHVYYKNSSGGTWTLIESFIEDTPAWTERSIILPNPSTTYYVAFEGIDGYGYGVCLDDILITGNPTVYDNDLAGQTISGNTIVNAGNTEAYSIELKNVGNNPQSNYTVKLFKQGGEEVASLDVSQAIAPSESVTHNMIWDIPANQPAGTTYLYGQVVLAGDENLNNDNTNNLEILIYPQGIMEISVGDGTETNNRTPISFQHKNSLTETIYFADELAGAQGMITALTYYNDFTSTGILNKPTALWIGETTQTNLTDGWIPSTSLTEVFNGTVSYPQGTNDILIQLTTPYFYNGSNLVVMAFRPMELLNYGSTDYFIHDETLDYIDRTRYQRDDDEIFDPASPPDSSYTFEKFANTKFTFFLGAMGEVEGYVYDDLSNPIEGASVTIEETQTVTYTDDEGYYHFGNVIAGMHDFTAYILGYSPQTITEEVLEDETNQVNFNLIPLGAVPVSGHVVGSDNPGVGLENATVEISGFENYQTITDANGDFVIEEVYTNITYNLTITHDDYDNYMSEITVENTALDLGTITVNEIAYPPGNVQAVQNPEGTEVSLFWSSPGQGGGEFRYDDGDFDFQTGFNTTPPNAVFGSVHPNISIVQKIHWYLSSEYGSHAQAKLYLFGLDDENQPDTGVIIYESGYVDNVDDEWNIYYLPAPVEAYEGFFVGISTPNEYTSIGMDDGVDEPWEFQSGTQFCKENWTLPGSWIDVGSYGPNYERNLMIRAYGINMGNMLAESMYVPENKIKTEPIESRELESYNVYRFYESQHNDPGSWDLIEENTVDTAYVDLNWVNLQNATYQFAIRSVYTNGVESLPAFSALIQKTSATAEEIPELDTQLSGNYPNPFNPITTISFSLAEASPNVTLSIFNMRGQKVKTLLNCEMEVGEHVVTWQGTDHNNKPVSSGVYFYRLSTNDKVIGTKRMLLLK